MQASACRTGARSSRVSRARLPSDPAHPAPSGQARGRAGTAHHSHGCSATRPSSAVPASAASGLACSPYQCRSASSCTRRVSVSRPGSGIAPSEGAMHQGSIARPERRRAPAGAKSYAAGAAQNGQTSKQGELGGRRRLAGLARRRQRVCSGDTTRRAGRGRLAPARPCSTRARARRGGSAPRSRKSSAPAPPAPPATNSAAGHCSAAAARACRPVRLHQSACRVWQSACRGLPHQEVDERGRQRLRLQDPAVGQLRALAHASGSRSHRAGAQPASLNMLRLWTAMRNCGYVSAASNAKTASASARTTHTGLPHPPLRLLTVGAQPAGALTH